ncbi:hypothetical protein FSOLCH5_004222 [Fusarium solani]
MPPALSEDESSDAGGFSTPPRATRKSASAGAASDPNDDVDINGEDFDEQDEEGEEDEDLEEDEYVVEAIKKHIIDDDVSRSLANFTADTADGDYREA